MTEYLESVECSEHPLDIAFHPKRKSILAASLVDGTVEGKFFEKVMNSQYTGRTTCVVVAHRIFL